jgi:hypothetical protein
MRWGTCPADPWPASDLPSGPGNGAGLIASVEDVDSGCCDILVYTPAEPTAKYSSSGGQHKPENYGRLGDAVLKR